MHDQLGKSLSWYYMQETMGGDRQMGNMRSHLPGDLPMVYVILSSRQQLASVFLQLVRYLEKNSAPLFLEWK